MLINNIDPKQLQQSILPKTIHYSIFEFFTISPSTMKIFIFIFFLFLFLFLFFYIYIFTKFLLNI